MTKRPRATKAKVHKALPVAGYTDPKQKQLDLVNRNKHAEERVLRLLDDLRNRDEMDVNLEWLAIGRTRLQLAFMAINRAIFQPQRVALPEDVESGE